MKKNRKYYYLALDKQSNKVHLSTNKTSIAAFIGVHEATIRRWINTSPIHETDEYILWKDVPLYTIQRNNNVTSPFSKSKYRC